MEFIINVSKNGQHYFKVVVPYGKVKKVYGELWEKFRDCDLTVTQWEKIEKPIDINNCTF